MPTYAPPRPKCASRRNNTFPVVPLLPGRPRWLLLGGRQLYLPRQPIEARLLLVTERAVKLRQRRLDGVDRLQHGAEALLHGGEAAGRRQRLVLRAVLAQDIGCLGGRRLHLIERRALIVV